MGLNQTYKLLHSKANHKQNEKTTYKLGENICKPCNRQGLNFPDIRTAHSTQYQKNQTTQSKTGRPKQTFLQKRHADGQQAHEKMLIITNY